MLLLFLLSMVVQYNDPDPLFWMMIYGSAAMASLLFALQRLVWPLSLGVGAVALCWAIFLLPHVLEHSHALSWADIFGTVGMKTLAIELARELGGLLLVVVWMGILSKKVHRTASQAENLKD